ncbi:MAG: 4Fe-4S dicluster domain-containing protein [Candidatus Omnitrophota bacterium]
MTRMLLLDKADLFRRLSDRLKDFEIIGPYELPNRGIFYATLKDINDLYLGEAFTIEPIKKFFLNPSEELEEPLAQRQRIIIGARPCEVRGLELMDKVFDGSDHKDQHYLHNRQRSVIIGLSCSLPDKTCFCTSMEGSPVENRGMDALLSRKNEDSFFLEVFTQKAQDLFLDIGREAEQKEQDDLKKIKQDCIHTLKRKIGVPALEKLDAVFENDYWVRVSRPCLSCGVCTYLCPTCHCFDLVDEERKRLRCYDGCAFSDFTLEASGVNPRPTKKERYRQRVFHKFNYFKKNFAENLCVGCGRCIRYCPVKIDISEIIDKTPI